MCVEALMNLSLEILGNVVATGTLRKEMLNGFTEPQVLKADEIVTAERKYDEKVTESFIKALSESFNAAHNEASNTSGKGL